jgi:hypothetical protein
MDSSIALRSYKQEAGDRINAKSLWTS